MLTANDDGKERKRRTAEEDEGEKEEEEKQQHDENILNKSQVNVHSSAGKGIAALWRQRNTGRNDFEYIYMYTQSDPSTYSNAILMRSHIVTSRRCLAFVRSHCIIHPFDRSGEEEEKNNIFITKFMHILPFAVALRAYSTITHMRARYICRCCYARTPSTRYVERTISRRERETSELGERERSFSYFI